MVGYIQTPLRRSSERLPIPTQEPYLWLGMYGEWAGAFGAHLSRGKYSAHLGEWASRLQIAGKAVQAPRMWPDQQLGWRATGIAVTMPGAVQMPNERGVAALQAYTNNLGVPDWQLQPVAENPRDWVAAVRNTSIAMEVATDSREVRAHTVPAVHLVTAGLRLVVAASLPHYAL
ncbi:MAG TPA: hypothetical protein VD735_05800 [Candidatus Saccharimonadales bacterium]|nr:hypothetical protein [Candidatus Saccharimonadales bacterium]